jgi:hypothetical protein
MKIVILVSVALVLLLSYWSYSSGQSKMAVRAVDEFVINSALEVRGHIKKFGTCPDAMIGWDEESSYQNYQFEIWVGKDSSKYPVFFKCEGGDKYSYIVKYGMDAGIGLSGEGESDIKVTYGHFTELKELYIGVKPDVNKIVDELRLH